MCWDNADDCETGAAKLEAILSACISDGTCSTTNPATVDAIVGVSIGGAALVAIIIGTALHCRKRKAAGNAHRQRPRGNGNVPGVEQPNTTPAVAVSNQSFVGVQLDAAAATNTTNTSTDADAADDDYDYIMRLEEVELTTQRYQGKLRVPPDFTPDHDCRMTLLRAGDILGVPDLAGMVEDVATRLEEDGYPPTHPEYNSRFALYMYTFHANHLPSAQQFYAVLNAGLRSRQEGWFKRWMPFIYYLSRALRELPDVDTTVYKGMAMPQNVDKYNGKKKIHWSGFSSTTTSEAVAQKFAGIGGLVLKMDVQNGKNVQPYSWFGKEEAELVLSPNMEFIVEGYPKALKKPYTYAGRTYRDLVQLPTETLYS